MQNFGHDFSSGNHRRMLEKRQRQVITTTITGPSTTVTTVATVVRPPSLPTLIPRPRPGDDDDEDEDEDETTTRGTSTSRATTTTTESSSSTAISRALSSSAAISQTQRPTASSDLTSLRPSASLVPEIRTVTETYTPSASASATDVADRSTTGAQKSGGTIAGIVAGTIFGFIGLAIFTAFIVRHLRKRARDREEWDAAKFRRSALMLNDEKSQPPRTPRPPSMIERRAQANVNSVVSVPNRAYPFSDTASQYSRDQPNFGQPGFDTRGPATPQPYGSPNPYGAAPVPYTGQNMYGQGGDRGYGTAYGAAAGYGGHPHQQPQHHPQHPAYTRLGHNNSPAPFASYAPGTPQPSHLNPHLNVGPAGAGPMSRANTTASSLPNPFSESAPVSPRSSGASSSDSGHGRPPLPPKPEEYLARAHGDDDAPPAYTDDGTYAKLQRDVKNPVVMTVEGTTSGSPASAAPAPVAPSSTPPPAAATPPPAPAPAASSTPPPAPAPVPASSASPSTTATTTSSTTPDNTSNVGGNKARPISSHTVYDPSDAYGGM